MHASRRGPGTRWAGEISKSMHRSDDVFAEPLVNTVEHEPDSDFIPPVTPRYEPSPAQTQMPCEAIDDIVAAKLLDR